MIEEWKPIADWPDYAISNHGRVMRTTTRGCGVAGRIRKHIYVSGYPAVTLTTRCGRRKLLTIHRLVALAFLGEPPAPDMEVNHIDADRMNPRLDNLEWVTRSQNRQHGYDVGFCDAKGQRNGQAKLTDEAVRIIREEGGDRRNWPALAARFDVSKATIRDVSTRRTWAHVVDAEAA